MGEQAWIVALHRVSTINMSGIARRVVTPGRPLHVTEHRAQMDTYRTREIKQ